MVLVSKWWWLRLKSRWSRLRLKSKEVAQEGEDLAAVAPDGAEASEPAREEVRQMKKRARLSDLPIPEGVILGCSRCRHSRVGCAACRAKAFIFRGKDGSFVYRQPAELSI